MRGLCRLQDEFEVAYARMVVLSVDPPEVQSAFRAGLGARFTFLSDAERRWLARLGLLETTDTVHRPYLPAAFTLGPDLRVHRRYNGYWYFGRPTLEELRQDLRAILEKCRPDWDITAPELETAWHEGRKELFYPYGKTLAQTLGESDPETGSQAHGRETK